jgi:AcrR family transcriptional regulator
VRKVTTIGRDGRSTRWDPHRRERRSAIIAAAVSAIETHGPDVLTGQIADLAGVPRTHVYRHFDGKQALDIAVTRRVGVQILEGIRAGVSRGVTPREIIGGGLDAYLGWVDEHPNLYRFLAKNAFVVDAESQPGRNDAKAILAGELTGLLAGYLRAHRLDDAPAERTIIGVVGLVDNTALWWLSHPAMSRAELADWLTQLVWLLVAATLGDAAPSIDPDTPLPRTDG